MSLICNNHHHITIHSTDSGHAWTTYFVTLRLEIHLAKTRINFVEKGSSCWLPTQPFAWASAPGSAPLSVDARGVQLRAAHAAVRLGKCTHDRISWRSALLRWSHAILCLVSLNFFISCFFLIPIPSLDKSLFEFDWANPCENKT